MPPMQDHLYTGSECGTAQGAVLDHTGQDVPRHTLIILPRDVRPARGGSVGGLLENQHRAGCAAEDAIGGSGHEFREKCGRGDAAEENKIEAPVGCVLQNRLNRLAAFDNTGRRPSSHRGRNESVKHLPCIARDAGRRRVLLTHIRDHMEERSSQRHGLQRIRLQN
jgi:hypothetical protein